MLSHDLPALIIVMEVKDADESLQMVINSNVIRSSVKMVYMGDILSISGGAV